MTSNIFLSNTNYFDQVEILVCGAPTMDLSELRKVVVYDGYRPGDETIQHFWEVTTYFVRRGGNNIVLLFHFILDIEIVQKFNLLSFLVARGEIACK